MTTPGFTAEASLHRTATGLTADSVFGFVGRGDRRAQTSEDLVRGSEVVPAYRRIPPGHIHGGCICVRYASNGRCRLWLC